MLRYFRQLWIGLLLVLWFEPTPGFSAVTTIAVDTIVNVFDDDRDTSVSGNQITTPFVIRYYSDHWSIAAQTSYSALSGELSGQDGERVETEDISGLTDTAFSASYFPSWQFAGIMPTLGLTMNLPSGNAQLTKQQDLLLGSINEDLLTVSTFGEGFNIGGTLGLTKAFRSAQIGINSLYCYRGEYQAADDMENENVKPGDLIMISPFAQVMLSSAWSFNVIVDYLHEFAEQINGQESLQNGDIWNVSSSLRYTGEQLRVSGSLMYGNKQKKRELVDGKLQTEPENSNSNSVVAALYVEYAPIPELTLLADGGIVYKEESERLDIYSELPYQGASLRYDVATGLLYRFGRHWTATMKVRAMLLNQEANRIQTDEVSYWSVSPQIGLVYSF